MNPDDLTLVARHVMKLLVERRFDELEEATGGAHLSSGDMEAAVDDVGSALVMPLENVWRELDVAAIRNWPGAFAVKFDLWTARGRSKLMVELTLHTKNGKPVIEVDGIGPR